MKTKNPGPVVKEPAKVEELSASLQKGTKYPVHRAPKERKQFRELILSNPNYFGTFPESQMKPVLSMASNTAYEEIGCVGYNPETEQLHAVIVVKQVAGYVTGLCDAGSPEYVRFYIQDAVTGQWVDQGVTQVMAHDMPHGDPLSYAATLKIQPERKPCTQPNLLKVRAILSWNEMPAANTPAYIPVWGEVTDVTIQVQPLEFKLPHFEGKLPLTKVPGLTDVIIPKVTPKVLDWKALLEKKQAAPGRVAASVKSFLYAQPQTPSQMLKDLLVAVPDLAGALDGLLVLQGDRSYEELTCVGLNQSLNTLVATLVVKKPQGYMGGLCGPGSREYVAFYVDWGDGNGWTYAGTNSVGVHDIPAVPDGGIHYAVSLPVSTSSHTQPCKLGPVIHRVRAILSWEMPPVTNDPDWLPHWGNRLDTDIQVAPGAVVAPGQHKPFMETVGGMSVASINAQGLANGPAVMAGFTATDSPFGGMVAITGRISNPPAYGAAPLKYRIMVSDDNGINWRALTNKFPVWVSFFNGTDWEVPVKEMQVADDHGWYTYREAPPNRFVAGNVLAHWYTAPEEGVRKIRMDVKEPDDDIILGTQVVTVKLDNEAPIATFALETGGAICGTYAPGEEIHGTYSVTDDHLSAVWLHVDPPALATHVHAVFSTPTSYPSVATATGSGTVTITGLIEPCGYVLRLIAKDRTIVNSGWVGFETHVAAGLCVRENNK
ncbi:MAG TPA: hypothetical protein VNT75_20055 [Symbiobacteriaceae bacterium]|nr:hypothetical protein [Symbiobacteriaceae bacterium]